MHLFSRIKIFSITNINRKLKKCFQDKKYNLAARVYPNQDFPVVVLQQVLAL